MKAAATSTGRSSPEQLESDLVENKSRYVPQFSVRPIFSHAKAKPVFFPFFSLLSNGDNHR